MDFFKTTNWDEVNTSFETLPAGWYELAAVSVEDKETRAKTGRYLKIEFNVVGEKYKGRKVWNMYNYENPNATAQNIGKAQFKALVEAVGKDINRLEQVEEVLNIPFYGKLSDVPAGDHPAKNELQQVKPLVDPEPKSPAPNQVALKNDTIPF